MLIRSIEQLRRHSGSAAAFSLRPASPVEPDGNPARRQDCLPHIRQDRLPHLLTLIVAMVLLSACGGGKDDSASRSGGAPPSPAVTESKAPGSAPPVPPLVPGMSQTLTKSDVAPIYHLDSIGSVSNPSPQKAGQLAGDTPVLIMGWAIDPANKNLAGGIEVVLDGSTYIAHYGTSRNDVADYFKRPDYQRAGFELLLPPGQLAKGEHSASIRVIASNKKSYYQSEVVKFVVI